MKQILYTGDLPNKVIIKDGRFTERDRKNLKADEISKMQAHSEQSVFFRRYGSFSEKAR